MAGDVCPGRPTGAPPATADTDRRTHSLPGSRCGPHDGWACGALQHGAGPGLLGAEPGAGRSPGASVSPHPVGLELRVTPQRPTQDAGKLRAGQAPPVCRLAGAQAEEGTACSLVVAAPPSTPRRAAGSVWEAMRARGPAGGAGAQLRGREALRSVARNSCPSEGTEPGPQDHSAVSNMDSAFKNPHPHFKKLC